MQSSSLYLRSDVQVEPLFDGWYAWAHLIPPATAARNVTQRHFEIMKSYIDAPQLHAAAVRNPKMLGGPFIDYGGERVQDIEQLLRKTKDKRTSLLRLSAAIEELDTMLRNYARGGSLQPLYSKIPSILRGYIELVYDLNNQPSFRLIEPLLYRSEYYDRGAQSLSLSITSGDDRPFVLSTPRLPSDTALELHVPFEAEAIDDLFRSKTRPLHWESITNLIGPAYEHSALLRSMFTVLPPKQYQSYTGPGVRWRYFGHACILIETSNISILFDPVLSYTYESEISRYTYDDLPDEIDFVIITHNHQDHILLETLIQIRHKVKSIIVPRNLTGSLQDPSLRLMLNNIGFNNVSELQELDRISFESGSITGIPFLGEHCDLNVQSKLAYLIRTGAHSLLMLADSCNVEPTMYKHLHNELGDVDAIFLGMECDGAPLTWLYGPLLTQRLDRALDNSRRLAGSNYSQAIEIVSSFNPKEVYVYAMGQEPWLNHIMSLKYSDISRPITESNQLIETCQSRGIVAERLFGEKEILRGN